MPGRVVNGSLRRIARNLVGDCSVLVNMLSASGFGWKQIQRFRHFASVLLIQLLLRIPVSVTAMHWMMLRSQIITPLVTMFRSELFHRCFFGNSMPIINLLKFWGHVTKITMHGAELLADFLRTNAVSRARPEAAGGAEVTHLLCTTGAEGGAKQGSIGLFPPIQEQKQRQSRIRQSLRVDSGTGTATAPARSGNLGRIMRHKVFDSVQLGDLFGSLGLNWRVHG